MQSLSWPTGHGKTYAVTMSARFSKTLWCHWIRCELSVPKLVSHCELTALPGPDYRKQSKHSLPRLVFRSRDCVHNNGRISCPVGYDNELSLHRQLQTIRPWLWR